MLLRVVKQFCAKLFMRPVVIGEKESAGHIVLSGDLRTMIDSCRKFLERHPHNLEVMNHLGCALFDIGEKQEAFRVFAQAYALDDTYLPIVVNQARSLLDRKLISEGMELILKAKVYEPDNPNLASVYAGIAMTRGDARQAAKYALDGWMGSFDTLRAANCYLFYSAYVDIDGKHLAAEHRFWAETLLSLPVSDESGESELAVREEEGGEKELPQIPPKGDRIRIAYWSPDLRNHSVGFFALPLFNNHDRSRFEVIAYHDWNGEEDATKAIKAGCDHFIPVFEMTDARLSRMILAHDLDILVELAGHSSYNRLNRLQQRLAPVQITGLGYPPTTGLSTIDAKIIDVHMLDDDSDACYTETPLVMDHSFWCFDGSHAVSVNPEPPCVKNGYLTFACSGNIAKITDRMLGAWLHIMMAIPDSKLVLRSFSFSDPDVVKVFGDRSVRIGLDMERVSLHGPANGPEFYGSYNDVDVVLDTYPFNGGTTTCFATYMGVPVLTMEGNSLISKMGKSILTNLGMQHWIVRDLDEYVEKAITLSCDVDALRAFRASARALYAASPLGNGELFTREFERKCVDILEGRWQRKPHQVPVLPADEMVGRAYRVCRIGQFDAAARIIDHCLANYPDCGSAHVLWTQRETSQGRFLEAAGYLESHLDTITEADRFKVMVNVARFNILAGQPEAAKTATVRAARYAGNSPRDALQLAMLQAYVAVTDAPERPEIKKMPRLEGVAEILVLIFCEDFAYYSLAEREINEQLARSEGVRVSFRICPEINRRKAYIESLKNSDYDAVLVFQKHVTIIGNDFLSEVLNALDRFDVVGLGGSTSWSRLDWRYGPAHEKSGCLIVPSGEKSGFFEILHSGVSLRREVGGLAVLDGSFLALRNSAFRELDLEPFFDPALEDSALYLEEYFSHVAHQAGLRLGVHQNPGLSLDMQMSLAGQYVRDARWYLTEKLSFDPFADEQGDDQSWTSVTVESAEVALAVVDVYLNPPD